MEKRDIDVIWVEPIRKQMVIIRRLARDLGLAKLG